MDSNYSLVRILELCPNVQIRVRILLRSISVGCFSSFGFVVRGESPGCRLFGTGSMLEWLRKLPPPHTHTHTHHSQVSSTERWSRNTLRVDTARVFYVLRGVLTSLSYIWVECGIIYPWLWSRGARGRCFDLAWHYI